MRQTSLLAVVLIFAVEPGFVPSERPVQRPIGERPSALAEPLMESIARDVSTLESEPAMADNKHVVVR
jgi:hypothetical protein